MGKSIVKALHGFGYLSLVGATLVMVIFNFTTGIFNMQ